MILSYASGSRRFVDGLEGRASRFSVRSGMTIVELAFEVGSALAEGGVVAVLSDGGAAATYAPEA